MIRFPKTVYLPSVPGENMAWQLFKLALLDGFRWTSLVTRDIQAPPVAAVDLNGVDQDIVVNVTTALPFVKARVGAFDSHGFWRTVDYRYLPKETGYYAVALHVTFELVGGLAAAGNIRANIRKNGQNEAIARIDTDSATAVTRSLAASKIVYLNGGTDYLDFAVAYSAGTALKVLGTYNRTYATIGFLGGPQVQ